jgi:hypothetical protein
MELDIDLGTHPRPLLPTSSSQSSVQFSPYPPNSPIFTPLSDYPSPHTLKSNHIYHPHSLYVSQPPNLFSGHPNGSGIPTCDSQETVTQPLCQSNERSPTSALQTRGGNTQEQERRQSITIAPTSTTLLSPVATVDTLSETASPQAHLSPHQLTRQLL